VPTGVTDFSSWGSVFRRIRRAVAQERGQPEKAMQAAEAAARIREVDFAKVAFVRGSGYACPCHFSAPTMLACLVIELQPRVDSHARRHLWLADGGSDSREGPTGLPAMSSGWRHHLGLRSTRSPCKLAVGPCITYPEF
jgi:hypothetical protein